MKHLLGSHNKRNPQPRQNAYLVAIQATCLHLDIVKVGTTNTDSPEQLASPMTRSKEHDHSLHDRAKLRLPLGEALANICSG
jgi:hypothetical protein